MDRNIGTYREAEERKESLSARRAWIEIRGIEGGLATLTSRSPQGERG